ncbi:MAG TPA: HU family DNA-binding protein [Coxiellaceae bacterium]|nr:HU family DNA-binding protein [Coxiellaceae bacterium]
MNKAELCDEMANRAGLSKADALRALDSMLEISTEALCKGDSLVLVGFGTLVRSHRAARQGRNPQTGVTMKIPASYNVKFKAGKKLKDSVNEAEGVAA